MKCKLVAGQHVLCLGRSEPVPNVKILTPYIVPEIGKVYTVERVTIGVSSGEPCLVLKEIGEQKVRLVFGGQTFISDVLFRAKYFKPLDRIHVEDFFRKGLINPKILDKVGS
jgi:hypothetical protein